MPDEDEVGLGKYREVVVPNIIAIIFQDEEESVKTEDISAHKFILASVSDVFATMFFGEMKEEGEVGPKTRESIHITQKMPLKTENYYYCVLMLLEMRHQTLTTHLYL